MHHLTKSEFTMLTSECLPECNCLKPVKVIYAGGPSQHSVVKSPLAQQQIQNTEREHIHNMCTTLILQCSQRFTIFERGGTNEVSYFQLVKKYIQNTDGLSLT